MTPNTTGAVSPNPSVVKAVQRLYNNLSSAPFDAEKCFVSLDDHRTLVAGFTHLLAALNKDQVDGRHE